MSAFCGDGKLSPHLALKVLSKLHRVIVQEGFVGKSRLIEKGRKCYYDA